ncbi:MAG TPA: aminotransferase class IV [Acidimicrobiia bacterium]|nr:aminotransferase class IV [Acidimicrobiia bacterium]
MRDGPTSDGPASDGPRVWVNGALVAPGEARLSPFDHGLLVGDGVFETLRVYGGVPFAWTRHLDRLARSASGLGLPLPDRDDLRHAADEVLAANGVDEARLRITVTGGPAPLGSERGETAPTVIVAATACGPPPEAVSVVIVPWARNERGATTGLKTISYAENVRALAHARSRGADEAVFANTRGNLCEATGSNVFFLDDDDVLVTPPAEAGCLLGVTRALTIELCARLGIRCAERDVTVDALRAAREAFLTSTTREVQAISAVDGAPLASAPGELTRTLADAFTKLVASDLDP